MTHRDIKLENIIIDTNGSLKLIDFGFCCATRADDLLTLYCGTPSYMSPEIVQKRPHHGPPIDVWACGILMFALLCGQFPFRGQTDRELYQKITQAQIVYPDYLSKEARDLISSMTTSNASYRPTASELLKNSWFH